MFTNVQRYDFPWWAVSVASILGFAAFLWGLDMRIIQNQAIVTHAYIAGVVEKAKGADGGRA